MPDVQGKIIKGQVFCPRSTSTSDPSGLTRIYSLLDPSSISSGLATLGVHPGDRVMSGLVAAAGEVARGASPQVCNCGDLGMMETRVLCRASGHEL